MTTAVLGQQQIFARNQKSSKNTDPKKEENIRLLFLDRMLSLLPSDVQYFAQQCSQSTIPQN